MVQFEKRFDVYWGGWSMINGMNALIKTDDDTSDRYIFFSGLDYPLVSNDVNNDFFEKYDNDEFIKTVQLSGNGNKFFSNRLSYPWLFDYANVIKKNY